jgi:hypothetical protein
MKVEALAPGTSVSPARTKGTCPICAILKDFQWTLAETARTQSDLRVCNFHGWALARFRAQLSRSTPGESVTTVFLEMLKLPLVGKANREECTLCHRALEEEGTRLRELAQKLEGTMFAQWMKSQGNLCLDHGRKVKEFPIAFTSGG